MAEENVLNIQIKVTDEQMNQLIKGKLEDMPDDKIQDILGTALSEFFKTDNGQRLFYTKEYYQKDPQPTELLMNMISNAVSKDLVKPCVDKFIETLYDNYPTLIQNAIIQVFSELFFDNVKEINFRNEMINMVNNVCNSRLNNLR